MESPYAQRLEELRAKVAEGEARSARISSWRGITFLALVGVAGATALHALPEPAWALAAASGAAFVGLVVAHARLVTRGSDLELRVKLLEAGERRSRGDLSGAGETGERFLGARFGAHPYARDLDVFGASSLFRLACAAETGPGQELLASWLAAPASAEEIASRQPAVRELAAKARFREDLAAFGAASRTQGRGAAHFFAWAEETPSPAPSPLLMLLGRAIVPVTIASYVVPRALGMTGLVLSAWVALLAIQSLLLALLGPSIGPVLAPVSSREAPFGRYVAILRLIEEQSFEDARLASLRDKARGAAEELTKLETILNYVEVRSAGLGAVILNRVLMWDVFSAGALLSWRARAGRAVRGWIDALAEMDALASLGTFTAEHPSFTFPVVGAGDLGFVAEGLGHPLIPRDRRVVNDVSLPRPGTALLITGSNMSGKSTLLRAIGLNAVLGCAGAPVCAERLTFATCHVWTSMRIADSLEGGVSHFYAELERLKAIVDAVAAPPPENRVMFLLDEVLHGTNSRERILGAKAVVKRVLASGAIGGVTSHDLGLAGLEPETDGAVRNVHLEELVEGSRMTFDYKVKPGVVKTSNALRLMKIVGIEVELPEGEA